MEKEEEEAWLHKGPPPAESIEWGVEIHVQDTPLMFRTLLTGGERATVLGCFKGEMGKG